MRDDEQPETTVRFDHSTVTVSGVVAYLFACVLGAVALMGQGGTRPAPGQFVYLFLLVCPFVGGGWLLIQSALEAGASIGSKTRRAGLLVIGVITLGIGLLAWRLVQP